MKELKGLDPRLHVEITNFVMQNTTADNLTVFDSVVELKVETDLLRVLIYFDINKQDRRSGYSLSIYRSNVHFKNPFLKISLNVNTRSSPTG